MQKIKDYFKFLETRILWADIAKCFAIICIIWGHAGSGSNVIFYRNVLYTFHVPTFLIISGFLTKLPSREEKSFKFFIKFCLKNLLVLIVPYIFWGIFFSTFTVKNVLPILYGSYQTIKTVNVIGALWFVPCFFFARIISYGIALIFDRFKLNKLFYSLFVVCLLAIGFSLPLLDNGYFWSFNISIVMAAFVILGIILKEVLDILSKSKWWVILLTFIVCFAAFYFGTFFRGDSLELVCMYNGKYGNKFWFIYNAIFGSGSIISLSMLIAKINFKSIKGLQYIGTQTLGLLFFHVPFMRQVMMPFFTEIGFVSPDWLVALIAAICTLIVCLICNFIVVLICPELVGQKRR